MSARSASASGFAARSSAFMDESESKSYAFTSTGSSCRNKGPFAPEENGDDRPNSGKTRSIACRSKPSSFWVTMVKLESLMVTVRLK